MRKIAQGMGSVHQLYILSISRMTTMRRVRSVDVTKSVLSWKDSPSRVTMIEMDGLTCRGDKQYLLVEQYLLLLSRTLFSCIISGILTLKTTSLRMTTLTTTISLGVWWRSQRKTNSQLSCTSMIAFSATSNIWNSRKTLLYRQGVFLLSIVGLFILLFVLPAVVLNCSHLRQLHQRVNWDDHESYIFWNFVHLR